MEQRNSKVMVISHVEAKIPYAPSDYNWDWILCQILLQLFLRIEFLHILRFTNRSQSTVATLCWFEVH